MALPGAGGRGVTEPREARDLSLAT
jgi:hypothetical protein